MATKKVSVRTAARDAIANETRELKVISGGKAPMKTHPDGSHTQAASMSSIYAADSFVNFAHKLGVGADNPLSSSTYGFNPITRRHLLLEWIHRGSWLGGVAVDVVADDMTRAGVEFTTEMEPQDIEKIDELIASMHVWTKINETIKWGRLYGGALGVILIDGQDLRTPLRVETVGKGAFKGILPLDRWMADPALEDLVTEFGPHLGMPKYYRIGSNAPALRNQTVHYSRIMLRPLGIKLPYQQALTENLWGISVIERLYDRMIAYDSATTGVAQLVFKSYLRTLKVTGMREVVSSGGPALDGLVKYTEMMRRYQGIEGVTMIDGEDEFEAQVHGAFSGLADALNSFAEQLSGALQIPLTRLFGQSPSGLNATGDNDMRNYFDHIKQRQQADLSDGVRIIYQCAAQSLGIKLPENFAIGFRSLWQLTETDKVTIAKTATETIMQAYDAGLISAQVALQELRAISRITGIYTNITQELIDAAEQEPMPQGEGMFDPQTGEQKVNPDGSPVLPDIEGGKDGKQVRPQGKAGAMGKGKSGGKPVQQPAKKRSPSGK